MAPAAVLTTSALLAGIGCLASRGPSNVAQGLEYKAGNANFDSFFSRLFQVQLTMADASEREQKIRERLARKLGLLEPPEPSALAKAVREQTQRLAADGVTLELLVIGLDPSEQAALRTELKLDAMPHDPRQRKLVRAIEEGARAEAELLGVMRESRTIAERLRDQAPSLEPAVRSTFLTDGPNKRTEVEENLKDAQRIIPLMIQRATDVADRAEAVLDILEQAANTAPRRAPPPPAEEPSSEPLPLAPANEPAGKPAVRSRSRPRPAPQSAPAPPAPPNPKPPPPPADDFEP